MMKVLFNVISGLHRRFQAVLYSDLDRNLDRKMSAFPPYRNAK